MKKLLLISTLLFFACSSDDSDDNISNNYKLVDTINFIWTDTDNEPPNRNEINATYNYNGNKLSNITFDEVIVNYLYNNNNQISGIYHSTGDSWEAEYDNQGRIKTLTYTDVNEDFPSDPPDVSVQNFNYNQNGSVTRTIQGQNGTTTFLFDQKGNVTSIIHPSNEELYYTYDNKNNPFKNILGNTFYINFLISFYGLPGLENNVITAENENNRIFYTYDSDDYPINFNSPNGFNSWRNIQATITYTN
tara:strand:- start:3462 stop:4205 length:744 start_codon:yes stop_codon:yes gene_type:complete